MPRNKKLYEHNEASYLMDHSGMLVMLPYDLRVSTPSQTSGFRTICFFTFLFILFLGSHLDNSLDSPKNYNIKMHILICMFALAPIPMCGKYTHWGGSF